MSTSKTGIITLSTHKLEFIANIAAKIGLQKIIKFLMIFFINCYQKYLSPYKGFSCAYRKLYQAESCSEYFKIAIANTNLTTAIPLFQKRLVDCKLASRTLKVNSNYPQKKKNQEIKNLMNTSVFVIVYHGGNSL